MPARIPMTAPQREAFLALPDTEEAVLRFHHLDADDLVAIATARPEPGSATPCSYVACAIRGGTCVGARCCRRSCWTTSPIRSVPRRM